MHYKRIHGAIPTFVSQINASLPDIDTSANIIAASAAQDVPTDNSTSAVTNENEMIKNNEMR